MVNNRAKMSRSNVKARRWMEAHGFEDITVFGHSRFQSDLHFQEKEFDGIASHNNKVVLFQVKTNCKSTKKIILDYKTMSERFGIEVYWFNAVDRKGLEINNQPAESYLL